MNDGVGVTPAPSLKPFWVRKLVTFRLLPPLWKQVKGLVFGQAIDGVPAFPKAIEELEMAQG